jgi:DNA-directed RNA polymerase specialized sigma24 family protein
MFWLPPPPCPVSNTTGHGASSVIPEDHRPARDFRPNQTERPRSRADEIKSSSASGSLSDEAIERLWDLQWRQYHLRQAMRQVEAEFNESDRTAFLQYAINGLGAKETAETLKMSMDQVYQAKCRILKRLSDLIEMQVQQEG